MQGAPAVVAAAAFAALFLLLPCAGVVGAVAAAPGTRPNFGHKSSKPWLPRTPVVTAPTGEELVGTRELPRSWDWRNVDGKNLVTSDVNQHIPQYCGSCWIHGTTAALNDRIKVLRGGAWPDVMLSRQALMNCVPHPNGSYPAPGCDGGDTWQIHSYLHQHKVPDETCMPYQAKNGVCEAEWVCRNCAPAEAVASNWVPKSCFAVGSWSGYGVRDYGLVNGTESMMKEIYARGPIACSLGVDEEFLLRYSDNVVENDGVFVSDAQFNDTDHVVEVTGWGTSPSGIKYWVVRNSWGTYWGDAGWFKVRRGVNQNLIESECDWAVPQFDDLNEALNEAVLGDYVRGVHRVHFVTRASLALSSTPIGLPTLAALAFGAALASLAVTMWLSLAETRRRREFQQPAVLG